MQAIPRLPVRVRSVAITGRLVTREFVLHGAPPDRGASSDLPVERMKLPGLWTAAR